MILSQEQMLKAMQCATVQELVSFAKEQDLKVESLDDLFEDVRTY